MSRPQVCPVLAPGPVLHSGDGDGDVRPWPVTQHPIVSAFLCPRGARSEAGPLGYPLGWVWVLLPGKETGEIISESRC